MWSCDTGDIITHNTFLYKFDSPHSKSLQYCTDIRLFSPFLSFFTPFLSSMLSSPTCIPFFLFHPLSLYPHHYLLSLSVFLVDVLSLSFVFSFFLSFSSLLSFLLSAALSVTPELCTRCSWQPGALWNPDHGRSKRSLRISKGFPLDPALFKTLLFWKMFCLESYSLFKYLKHLINLLSTENSSSSYWAFYLFRIKFHCVVKKIELRCF